LSVNFYGGRLGRNDPPGVDVVIYPKFFGKRLNDGEAAWIEGAALLLPEPRGVAALAGTRNSSATIAVIRRNSHAASLYPARSERARKTALDLGAPTAIVATYSVSNPEARSWTACELSMNCEWMLMLFFWDSRALFGAVEKPVGGGGGN
jgi:hypothetical protein